MRWLRRVGRWALRAVVFAAALYAGLAVWSCSRPAPPPHPFFTEALVNIAHRGGALLAPEETLAAFDAAREAGAHALELDLHLSADGELVVFHDRTLDRTTDGVGPLAEKTLAELRTLNAGATFRGPDGGYPYRGEPVRIPTFDEVLDAHPGIPLFVEMKVPEAALPLCRAIRAAGREDEVLVAAFSGDALAEFRGACPGVATGAAPGEAVWFVLLALLRLPGLHAAPPEALLFPEAVGPLRVAAPTFLRAARRAGLPLLIWTVNDRSDMIRLLDLGVDGILTDDPATLAGILESRAR